MKMDSERGSTNERMRAAPLLFSARLTLFIVCLFATFTFILQRLNVSFALVCMVKRNVNLPLNLPSNQETSMNEEWSRQNQTLALLVLNETEIEKTDSDIMFEGEGLHKRNDSGNPRDGNLLDADAEEAECRLMALSSMGNSSFSNTTTSSSYYVDDGEFEWSRDVEAAILSSFFYGYIFTQVLGGWLSERFGGKFAFLGSIASLSVLTILNPLAAMQGPEYLFAVRLLQGLSHGAAMPSINVFSARWCAPAERAFLLSIAYGGFSIAATATFPISGFLCTYLGWTWIFYITGLVGIILCFAAYFLVFDWPEDHPRISARELEYLKKTRAVDRSSEPIGDKLNVPWRRIAFSWPINVVHITHFCGSWGFNMISMYLPTFMKEVLYMDTSKNGLYSSLPYLGMLILHFSVGSIFDYFRRSECCSVTNLRKIFNTIGMLGPTVSMIYLGFLSCTNTLLGLLAISVGQSFGEFCFMGGYYFSVFELAPRYAGIITGVSNTFGVLTGILCPIFVAYMTPNGSREEWIIVFLVTAGINALGIIIYIIFGSSELQSWAESNSELNRSQAHSQARPKLSQNDSLIKELQEKLLKKELSKRTNES